jgi:predicted nucleic acid-binding protein
LSGPEKRYWDSCCFLGWLKDEPDKIDECRSILRSAEQGHIKIVTSAVTLTEVVRLKGSVRLAEEDEARIKAFFEHPYILIANLDRFVAEKARGLCWTFPALKPKDALHIASAIHTECPYLDTFDADVLGLNGKLSGVMLHIGRPAIPVPPSPSYGLFDKK